MSHSSLAEPVAARTGPDPTITVPSRRNRLLATAPRLAELFTLEQLTPELVAEAAQLGEADFHAEFKTFGDFMAEVHHHYLEKILGRLIRDTGSMPPSADRILRASLLQLDLCLEMAALRRLIMQARRQIPRVAEDLYKRNKGTSLMISLELKTLGCKHPMVAARYWCQLVLEAAEIEADAGGKVMEARGMLVDFLHRTLAEKA